MTSVTDARSNATSYVRNGFGDVIRQSSPDTGVTDLWYDAAGRVIETLDARNIETNFTYDNLGRMLTKTFPASSGENVAYTYDSTSGGNKGVGRLTSVTDASGSTAFTYNALGQVTRERRIVQSITYDTDYLYDADGNVTQITYPSGRIVNYTRDSVGRITGAKESSGASAVTITSSGTYSPFGPLTGFTFGNGVGLTLTFDQDYQLTGIDAVNGGTTIQDLAYGYDNAGNITTITDNYQSGRSQTLGYDNLNRLNSASGAYGSLAFTYDGVGNRTTRVVGGTTETFNTASTSNRLTGTTISGSPVRTVSYLASGQISQDVRGGSTTYGFTYNNNGRLSSAALNSSTVGTYLHNWLEQRVAKTASSVTTHYVLDRMGHLLSENTNAGAAIREYIWLDDMPVAQVDATGMSPVIHFVHTDHLGRPQKMSNSSSALVWDAVYQPFGEAYSVTGSATNLLMFPGQFYDSGVPLEPMLSREAACPASIAVFCGPITRHNTLGLRSPTFTRNGSFAIFFPCRQVAAFLARQQDRSARHPPPTLRAKAAGRSLRRSQIAIKAAMVAGLETATGDHRGSNWLLHPRRRRRIVHWHHQDARAQHQGAPHSRRTLAER